jgi:hypothetical protein
MPLLLLTPREDIADTFKLADAAQQLGWQAERVSSYQPSRTQYPQDIVLYGETFFTTLVSQKLSYVILEPDFDLLPKFPSHFLKREIRQMTLEEARQLKSPVFAKPADGNKAFESQVYDNGAAIPSRYLSKTLPVITSTPVQWAVEYRFFALERNIATSSVYARNGQLALDEHGNWAAPENESAEAVSFCMEILGDLTLELPPALVLDLGFIPDTGWALVEPNPVSSSGIYGCDPQRVLATLQRVCIRDEEVSASDRRWAVNRPL